jgi:hypothetical protein
MAGWWGDDRYASRPVSKPGLTGWRRFFLIYSAIVLGVAVVLWYLYGRLFFPPNGTPGG